MLTVPQHLLIRRPSPTTVEFTVTTAPPLTPSLRLLLALTILLRILTGIAILLVLHTKYIFSSNSPSLSTIAAYITLPLHLQTHHLSPPLHSLLRTTSNQPWALLLPLSILLLRLLIHTLHTHESLLVLRGLGIQTRSSPPTYLSTGKTRFIPTEKIQDIYINEAFRGFEVRYYLGVVVRGEGEVLVVFPGLLPGRMILEGVWRGARAGLWGLERGREEKRGRGDVKEKG